MNKVSIALVTAVSYTVLLLGVGSSLGVIAATAVNVFRFLAP